MCRRGPGYSHGGIDIRSQVALCTAKRSAYVVGVSPSWERHIWLHPGYMGRDGFLRVNQSCRLDQLPLYSSFGAELAVYCPA